MKKTLDSSLENAQLLHQKGELDAARTIYLHLLENDPRNPTVLHMLGILCAEENNYDAAQSYMRKALTLSPEDPTLYLHLANIFKAQALYDQAGKILLDLIERYPQFVPAYNNLGTVFYAQKKWSKAIKAFHDAIALQSDYLDAYYNLGLAYFKNKNAVEAINTFKALLELNPQHPGARFQLGLLNMNFHKYDQAIYYFEQMAQAFPFHFETQSNLATCYLKIGDLQQAKKYYLHALNIHKDDTQILFNLGVIATQQGLMQEAIKYYSQCVALDPDYFPAYNNLGVAALALKDYVKAREFFIAALRLQSHNEAIKHTLNILSENKNITSSPIEYVQALFDGYADHYDEHLARSLNYEVPQLFKEVLQKHAHLAKPADILDLGCGTGLCATVWQDRKRLTGVDISEKMLNVAGAKHLYDDLIRSDLLEFLQSTSRQFDLVTAGDVIVYYGELEGLFPLVAKVLRPKGYFIFNTEISKTVNYEMTESGRFVHSQKYIEALSALCHFQIVTLHEGLIRKQNNKPIEGYIFLLQKR